MGLVEMLVVDEQMQPPTLMASAQERCVRSLGSRKAILKTKKLCLDWRLFTYRWYGIHQGEHGYFKITDKVKDIIKVGGEWVSSLELESVINQHPG